MLASMKLLNIPLNLLNVLAFRLVLAIGVDYGIYIVLIWQKAHDLEHDVAGVVKPVLLAGLTAVSSGFGSLALARNPSLSGSRHRLRHRDFLEPGRDDFLYPPGGCARRAPNMGCRGSGRITLTGSLASRKICPA